MSQTIINVGTGPDAGNGDPLRTAFVSCNSNFSELYETAKLPGFSPIPLCMSNQTSVGLGYNTYILAVSDSKSRFNRCKVYVDGLGAETPFLEVSVYVNGYGSLRDGLESFRSDNPSSTPLKQVAVFDQPTAPLRTGVVELSLNPNYAVDYVAETDQGENIVVVISANEQVSLIGHSKGFNPINGMFTLGTQQPMVGDDGSIIAEALSSTTEATQVPSVQFYELSPNNAPA